MKRFRFPLRPVAILRANRELKAREALAASMAAHAQTEARLAATRARILNLEELVRRDRSGAFLAGAGATFNQAYRREWAAEAEAQRQVNAARAVLDRSRDACVEANRELKAIARLEENARGDYEQLRQRDEQGQLDEIAGQRAARRRHAQSL
jgi:flagellar FliJ protein